ncbi:hypothetical protein TIFTF001_038384 [Ficus carica]|uniref:Uncharacterized protein n=1 Tax=Ficus carica TaxID=3494 RepID=A0AA88J9W0_FICCA|nr:hypothetical protein TIFTF001_038384 [Ficus carica]
MMGPFSPHLGKCLVVHEGVYFVLSQSYNRWDVETDAINMVRATSNPVLQKLMLFKTFVILMLFCKWRVVMFAIFPIKGIR